MFMGHFGPAVWDTQRGHAVPIVTLWQGFLAVQFIDIIFAVLAIVGIEGSIIVDGEPVFYIPWSHSLISAILLSCIGGALFRAFKPTSGTRGMWVVAALIFSHWVLDLIVHRPDLPLYPGSQALLGFGVWNYPFAAYILEMGLLFAGFVYWLKVTTGSRVNAVALWLLFAFMAVIQFIFITAPGLALQNGTFDPATQLQGGALGISALATFAILAGVVGWIEKGRSPKLS